MQPRSAPHPLLRLEWQGSRRLAVLLGVAHALSVAAVLLAALPWWIKVISAAVVLASAVTYIGRALVPSTPQTFLRSVAASRHVTALEFKDDGAGAARTLDGQWHEAQLTPAFAAPLFAIVRVKLTGWRLPKFVVMMPDMLTAEDYRRLLVRLRWG